MTPREIAQVCHEVNRAYCAATGDLSHKPWDDAPDWQKDSAVEGVKSVLTIENVTPRKIQEKWKAHKIADGWKYGPVKDADKKEHPCIVDYDALPEREKIKDYLFVAVVTTLAKL